MGKVGARVACLKMWDRGMDAVGSEHGAIGLGHDRGRGVSATFWTMDATFWVASATGFKLGCRKLGRGAT
ncbi:hypothetical protein R1flu_028322 [Riccia fluitans]|uniref:Uncharacterized protein n=1 Tax=Riccia fluitans TaxID=41844 RepID=A0ABD1XLU1_9MARC